jgi:hypothetical protein
MRLRVLRIIVSFLLLVMVFIGFDHLTAPSRNTAETLLDAVNKKLLEPAPLVEVRSAIRAADFLRVLLQVMGFMALFLLCSDFWLLWTSRKRELNNVT